ncbi:hypothetical protein B0H14DRAFT_2987491 [Mycena olivaceomarginata]|nr:hypothetical protein B0H14DRAFT_2987491 [Mycena olivaceomarginata]
MLNLLDLPMDLILALCRRMLLSDLISFLSSCSVLRGYTAERSLWIDVLHRTQQTEMQPIAQPIRQDLSKLNLHDLQNGARQTYRLAKNWMVPAPTPRSIREVGYVGGDSELIIIPGTGLVLVTGRSGSTSGNPLACWNIHVDPAECCASLDLGAHVVVESASFDEWGKVLLGAWDPSVNVHRLLAIRVDYRDLSAVSISLICSHDFDHRPRPEAWPTSHVSARRGTHIVPIRLPAHESLTGLPASGMSDVDEDLPARPTSDILHISYSMHALEFSLPAPGEQPVFGPVAMRVPVERDAKCHIAAASPSGRYALVVEGKQALLSRFGYGGTREDRPLELEVVNMGSSDWWMAMDDNLGLVLALHGNGTLRIFSYT